MLKKWEKKANQQNPKKHKSKIKWEKKGKQRKVKKGKNGKKHDLSICICFALILLFRFAKKERNKSKQNLPAVKRIK